MSVSTQQSGEKSGSEAETTDQSEAGNRVESAEPSLDVIFDVLRNRRRRLVMQALEERDGETTLSDLAEHIGGIENDKPPEALNAQERKRVYVGLYQCHLPKMHDAGAIEFDKDRGTVKRGAITDEYHKYLEREVDGGSRWPKYYGGVAAGACLLYVGAVTAVGPQPIVAITSLVLVGALSAYHWRRESP
ncbi:DUF7344 domain-containing protein [Halobellus rufus]|uniref:DUF7344 domain-containing protein n=1 Tax=Halobellus rufus TaxID=1448860 RepID=UPI00067967A5|nr:hypothetical protein [Halobellus rufus]